MARILIAAQHLAPGDSRVLKLRHSLRVAGHEVCGIAPHGPPILEDAQSVSAAHSRVPGPIGAYLSARSSRTAMIAAMVNVRPDIIYAIDPETLPAAVDARRQAGARLIYDAHEFHEAEAPEAPERGKWVRKTELACAASVDVFVTVNSGIAAMYAQSRPGLPGAIIVHNASPMQPEVKPTGRLRKAANLETGQRILLYHGAIRSLRGLNRLIDAAPMLPEDWRLVVMGRGPLEDELQKRANLPHTIFLPPVPNADLLSWASDASLGAALYEDAGQNQQWSTPNKLWEYPASGVPVLASDLPGMRSIVLEHKTGWLIDPNSAPEAIAAFISRLTASDLEAARTRARAFSQAFSWEVEVEPLLARILELAQTVSAAGQPNR